MGLAGLNQVFIELCSSCDKTHLCQMCAHQSDKFNPDLKVGQAPLELLLKIRDQLPKPLVVAFHRNGEPTAYKHLGMALKIFGDHYRSIVTHGLNLAKKANEIISNCEMVTVSIFHNDRDRDAQIETVKEFLKIRGGDKFTLPRLQLKLVGEGDTSEYESIGVPIIKRLLHNPNGNDRYLKRDPTIPESGLCQDFTGRPSIDWDGRVYICNRFDPKGEGYLGNLWTQSLDNIWNSDERHKMYLLHSGGLRDSIPACAGCKYYGVASEAE